MKIDSRYVQRSEATPPTDPVTYCSMIITRLLLSGTLEIPRIINGFEIYHLRCWGPAGLLIEGILPVV